MRIQALLDALEIDINELTQETGITADRVRALDAGEDSPSPDELARIMLCMRVNRNDLFSIHFDEDDGPTIDTREVTRYDVASYYRRSDNMIKMDAFYGHVHIELTNGVEKTYPISFSEYNQLLNQLRRLNETEISHAIVFKTLNNKVVLIPDYAYIRITTYSDDEAPGPSVLEHRGVFYVGYPTDLYGLAYHFADDNYDDYSEEFVERINGIFDEEDAPHFADLVVVNPHTTLTEELSNASDLSHIFCYINSEIDLFEMPKGVMIEQSYCDIKTNVSLRNALLVEIPLFLYNNYRDFIDFETGFIEASFEPFMDSLDME